jgi:hypothetical protein
MSIAQSMPSCEIQKKRGKEKPTDKRTKPDKCTEKGQPDILPVSVRMYLARTALSGLGPDKNRVHGPIRRR